MSVRDFELYHGAVLTKVLRSQKPVALRLVETRPQDTKRQEPAPRAERMTRTIQEFAVAIDELGRAGRVTDLARRRDGGREPIDERLKRAASPFCRSLVTNGIWRDEMVPV